VPYSLLKTVLQGAGVVKGSKRLAKHRIKRERRPLAGMMVYQDASPTAGWPKTRRRPGWPRKGHFSSHRN